MRPVPILLLAAGALSCDGIIGLSNPTVREAVDAADAEMSDVGEPSDSNETSTEEEASADAGPTSPVDSGADATSRMDSTVTPPSDASDATTGSDTATGTSGFVSCSTPTACGNTGTTYEECTYYDPDGGCDHIQYQTSTGQVYGCSSCNDCAPTLLALQAACASAASGPATVILLNSSPDLPSIRYCLVASGSPVAPILPIPDRLAPEQTAPGIDLWTGAPIPTGLGDPATLSVVPYVLRSDAIPLLPDGGTPYCSTLIGVDGDGGLLVPGVDFWALPVVPAGTFLHGTTGFTLLHGCLAASQDPTGTVARCGTHYDGGNDLRMDVYPFTPITDAGPTYLSARVLQGSQPLEGVLTVQTGSTTSEIVSFAGVSPMDLTFTGYAVWDGLPPAASSLNVQVVTEAGAPVTSYSWTLTDIAQTTTGSATAADGGPYYTNGQAYTFVIVGDPSAPADSGAQPHAIVFPDNLVPPAYP